MKVFFGVLICFSVLGFVQSSGSNHSYNEDSRDKIGEDEEDNDFYKAEDQCYYDTSSIYTSFWSINTTFAYRGNSYFAFGDTVDLKYPLDTMKYAFPVKNKVSSGFKYRGNVFHKGLDINLRTGDPVVSAFEGKVRYAKYNDGGFGNLVIIRHPNGLETYYAHLSKIVVQPNQIVKAGEIIGKGGSTGRSTGPHLHFEVRINDKAMNPAKIFNTSNFDLLSDKLVLLKSLFSA